MKKSILYACAYAGILIFILLLTSCSDDDTEVVVQMPTCTDGIMNGDETGIDCGGTSCQPCTEDPMMLGRRAELYVTNNADGNISKYSITGDSLVTLVTPSTAAEGIYYDATADVVIQASRSSLQLEAYSPVKSITTGTSVAPAFMGAADLVSPRELAVNGSSYVVADNDANTFFVYEKGDTNFTLTYTVQIPFAVWGITFKGDDLYAVVDKTGDLAVFNNFLANATNGLMRPSKQVTIEGIVRTHGLTYSGSDDTMILTDIGDAANTADDGGFHVISEFSTKFDALSDGDLLPLSEQVRVAGSSTLMGNPIDVAYDSETDAIYVSEVGNGKVLGFTAVGSGGDLTPSFNMDLPSASSLVFSSDETDGDIGTSSSNMSSRLYTTNNANGNINVYDNMGLLTKTITSNSSATEGIYYDGLNDAIIQASRSELMAQYYSGFSLITDLATVSADFSGSAELMSPREIAVFGNKVVVSDNGENEFYVYTYDGSNLTLLNTLQVGFNVWGITFMGNDLLAVVDNSSDLAVFPNFLSSYTADGMITAEKKITIEGIVRTHGIDYSESDDVLVMTDIGDAADANTDGGFHIIENFTAKLADLSTGGTLASMNQIRIAGPSTQMGNPIDVAYDHKTKSVFIAEVGNGKILGFSNVLNSSGDIAPSFSNDLMSASSLYLYNN
ncbi:hypothetical protein JQC67_16485 [Aurantibacter crassamenti]|uniref:hypothetical protein n=1 Tax=Aurantibacter crassamenti TaxID=1837375 RepID=UPI0019396D3C|nr:hypothetical protein [Aurantibacter crassamenti]MBM1107755.1 hypothetical protein [Aurantibacter crassamenti]